MRNIIHYRSRAVAAAAAAAAGWCPLDTNVVSLKLTFRSDNLHRLTIISSTAMQCNEIDDN